MQGTDFNVGPLVSCAPMAADASVQKINTIFTCGYIVGMIPSKHVALPAVLLLNISTDNLMLQVVPPRIWFPAMNILWGILTFWSVHLRVKSVSLIELARALWTMYNK